MCGLIWGQPVGLSLLFVLAGFLGVLTILLLLGFLALAVIGLLGLGILGLVLLLPSCDHAFTVEGLEMGEDAQVVGEEAAGDGGDPDGEDDLLLDGDGQVADTIVTGGDFLGLVEQGEVACVPGGEEGHRDDDKNASGLQANADTVALIVAALGISEVADSKASGDHERDRDADTDENVPPLDVVVQELVEDLDELDEADEDDRDGDELGSANDRATEATLLVFDGVVLAFADAAAALGVPVALRAHAHADHIDGIVQVVFGR